LSSAASNVLPVSTRQVSLTGWSVIFFTEPLAHAGQP
jgi:hypothetical protein